MEVGAARRPVPSNIVLRATSVTRADAVSIFIGNMLQTLTYRNGRCMSKKVEASGSDAIKNFGATQNESRYMFTVILALIYSVILR